MLNWSTGRCLCSNLHLLIMLSVTLNTDQVADSLSDLGIIYLYHPCDHVCSFVYQIVTLIYFYLTYTKEDYVTQNGV